MKNKIEISDEKYWRDLSYWEGMMYCQLLVIDGKNDWRMITGRGWNNNGKYWSKIRDEALRPVSFLGNVWFIGDGNNTKYKDILQNKSYIIPVRDV